MDEQTAKRIENISPFHVMAVLERAKKLAEQGRDVIHMEIGEPDFPTPQPIINAGINHIATGAVKYTAAAGLPVLREKIAAFYQQRYGVMVNSKNVFVTPGASGALLLALGVSLNAGENVLMADPCYPCNSNFIQLFEGKAKTIAVDARSNYQLTPELIDQHWTATTKGVLMASPSNPTGTLISAEQLQQCIQTVNALGGCFYSDEIYHGLVYDTPQATTALQHSRKAFIINSFSKYFGMTGWRIGWLIVPDAFIEATEKLAQNIFIATASHSQYAALAAFDEETLTELASRREEFAKRRDFLYENLVRLGFKIAIKPEGAFYIYANCARFTDDSYQFALDLLDAEAVAVTPGKDFGSHQAQHHIRFAYTQTLERMAIAMTRLEHFLKTR
jgi:aspartate/methionine/tyrosine aminotransferase